MDDRIRRSRAQEKRGAKKFGGQLQPGSGNGPFRKNDMRTSRRDPWPLQVEYKTTLGKRQITLQDDDLAAVMQNAQLNSRCGALGFDLGGRHYLILEEDEVETYRSLLRELIDGPA